MAAVALLALTGVLGVVTVVLAALFFYLWCTLSVPEKHMQLQGLKADTEDYLIRFKDIKFGRQIGKGSQGEVYYASWRGTAVAVKKVDTSAVDQEVIQEFIQEAHIMRQLRHPSVTLFMGICVEDHNLCIVTEFVQRGSLFELLKDKASPMTWQKCLKMAQDVARGLEYLHGFHPPIIHRDLKSLNILVDKNWRAKVADFGMTRFQDEGTMTQCGSPLWMAPEMILNKPYDEKVDVYSFGIVLWELYTRRVPYRHTRLTPQKLCVKVVKDHLRPVIPDTCPAPYSSLIKRCWHPDPAQRPKFTDIVATLETFMEDPIIIGHQLNSDKCVKIIRRSEDSDDEENGDLKTVFNMDAYNINVRELTLESKPLCTGFFATVFRGQYRGKKVAVKKWRVNSAAFQQAEIDGIVANIMERVSSLRHPNLVLFMGAFSEPGYVGVVEELMEGGTLQDIINDKHSVLEWNLMLQFLIDAAQGMTYLLSAKPPIAHGDLKPTRLLIDKNYRLKVSGYGVVDFEGTIRSVEPSVWMAPELLEDPMAGTAAANVYSFAMIMYNLATRQHPFQERGDFTDQLATDIVRGKRPRIPVSMAPAFAELIQSCWHRDRGKRPTFPLILRALQRIKNEGPPRVELTAQNATRYRKATTVFAFRSKDPLTVFKDWGQNRGDKGSHIILSGEDDVYICPPEVFKKTYERVPGSTHEFRKTGAILGRRMKYPFAMRTKGGMEHGIAGDYLVQNDAGDQWVIEGRLFPSLYEPIKNKACK